MKPPTKLKLNKITLRDLDENERNAVAGAGPSNIFTSCATCFSCPHRCPTDVTCP